MAVLVLAFRHIERHAGEVEFGQHLTEDRREALAHTLRQQLKNRQYLL